MFEKKLTIHKFSTGDYITLSDLIAAATFSTGV